MRQRVRFIVKARAAGSAKMFIDPPSHQNHLPYTTQGS
jgi:hypothetical protein